MKTFLLLPGILLTALLLSGISATGQTKSDPYLADLLASDTGSLLKTVIKNKDVHRLQIIYTMINRDKNNQPHFINYYFNYDPDLYFNPASIVKLPLAILSLEKLHEMGHKKIGRETLIQFDSSEKWHRPLFTDTTSASGKPSIGHFIKRALLISENDPYNRMYQFLGQQHINRRLKEKGYLHSRITRQFMGLTPEQNSITNPYYFLNRKNEKILVQPSMRNVDPFDFSKEIRIGKAYMNNRDSIINQPFDFTKHNYHALEDVQQMLQAILFPASVGPSKRFSLAKADRQFLLQYLSQFPSETPWPKYDTAKFYDSYVKFFFRNDSHKMPEGLRVFNKVGWSYGFLTDVSYVADFKNRIEYMLSATLYVNSDEILNDGKYEYNTVGYPFLYQLGQAIYRHELQRKREYAPDLSEFRIRYEKRDQNDDRPSLKQVDN